MKIERSILHERLIIKLIKQYYNIEIYKVNELELGTAYCYKLNDRNKSYFLKEFPQYVTEKNIEQESLLLEYLIEEGFPVVNIIKTINNEVFFMFQGHCVYLQEYIEGVTYDTGKVPQKLLLEQGLLLGKLHLLLKDYNLPCGMSENWIKNYAMYDNVNFYENLLSLIIEQEKEKESRNIIDNLIYRKELSYRIDDLGKYYEDITYKSSHGDYACFQCICESNKIKRIIDFSSAAKVPVVWELMRSYILSTGTYMNYKKMDISNFCRYISYYTQYSRLTEKDLKAMPYVYLYQLARSKYGYKEYFYNEIVNKKQMLKIANWRTEICKGLEEDAEKITQSLQSYLT